MKLKSQCVGLQRVNNNIIVGTMDDTLSTYSTKVRLIYKINLNMFILIILDIISELSITFNHQYYLDEVLSKLKNFSYF